MQDDFRHLPGGPELQVRCAARTNARRIILPPCDQVPSLPGLSQRVSGTLSIVNDLLHQPSGGIHAENGRKQHPGDKAVSRGGRGSGVGAGAGVGGTHRFQAGDPSPGRYLGGDYDWPRVAAIAGGEARLAAETA
jgi:hypothetical protein